MLTGMFITAINIPTLCIKSENSNDFRREDRLHQVRSSDLRDGVSER